MVLARSPTSSCRCSIATRSDKFCPLELVEDLVATGTRGTAVVAAEVHPVCEVDVVVPALLV